MKIPLLDLSGQYKTIRKKAEAAILRVARSQRYILGPEVENFERAAAKYLNVKHALGVSSGTDALLVALTAIGIQPGDEVIVPAFTFFATASAAARLNAVPVFADIDPVSFTVTAEEIERKITPRTKAVIPVHLYGQCAEMEPILNLARRRRLKVIEDAAQAIGAAYKDGRRAGTMGDAGCLSFYPSKNLGGFGDGGMVLTQDDRLFGQMELLRAYGAKPKYFHRILGGNFRLDALQAAVLGVKLPYLDGWTRARERNADRYTKLFMEAGLSEGEGILRFDAANRVLLPKAVRRDVPEARSFYHVYHQYVIRVEKRDRLRTHLTNAGIGTDIYYPIPLHLQECFQHLGYRQGDLPHAEQAAETTIALPVYPELTPARQLAVVRHVKNFLRGKWTGFNLREAVKK